MPNPTDDDILETAAKLARELGLDEDDRNWMVLSIQRLLWPPSPHHFLHDRPHSTLETRALEKGGWSGQLRCPHGCGRSWTVHIASTEEVVLQALMTAHTEYRTGRVLSVEPMSPDPRKVSLGYLLGQRHEYVEVHDDRLTPDTVTD